MTTEAYALKLEEQWHRDPIQGDFGKAWALDNPSGFRAYMVMSRYDPRHTVHTITDLYGRERWLTPAGWKVMCLALLYIQKDEDASTRELADAIGVCRQTVSRWLTKLTAWGIIGTAIVRGKYGGVVFFARRVGDNLEHYANVARARLRRIRARKLNVTSTSTSGEIAVIGHRSAAYYLPANKGAPLDFTHENALILGSLGVDGSRRQGSTKCPAHEDRSASLSWKLQGDRLLLHCFAGCTYGEIRKAAMA